MRSDDTQADLQGNTSFRQNIKHLRTYKYLHKMFCQLYIQARTVMSHYNHLYETSGHLSQKVLKMHIAETLDHSFLVLRAEYK